MKEGSSVLHLPECPTAPASSHQPSMMQLLGGGFHQHTPSVSPFFPLSIQYFKHTQKQVFDIHSSRADMGAVSNVPFQHMTERSHCNHTQLPSHLKNRNDNLRK